MNHKTSDHSHFSVGWQSWSQAAGRPLVRFPMRNYSPFPKNASFPRGRVAGSSKQPVTGWCTWHAYGTAISEQRILDQCNMIARHGLPLRYILIDDGWATWGDWLSPDRNKFPHGLGTTAAGTAARGFRPGLWIAPFLVHPQSNLAQEHPEWLVRDGSGRLVDGRKLTSIDRFLPYRRWILNLAQPEARRYLARVLRTVIEAWGFRFLKLDFLYAQHFNPAYRTHEEPDRLLRDFLSSIKATYRDVFISASGCPLAPAVGLVDAMRISEDIVNPQFRNIRMFNSLFHAFRLRQLEDNLARRMCTRAYWLLDPDAFIASPAYGLPRAHLKRLRKLIRAANGLVFLGDDLITLPASLMHEEILPLFTGLATKGLSF